MAVSRETAVRKKQCLLPLYFRTSYFWHSSLRMALSLAETGSQLCWLEHPLGYCMLQLQQSTSLWCSLPQHRLSPKSPSARPRDLLKSPLCYSNEECKKKKENKPPLRPFPFYPSLVLSASQRGQASTSVLQMTYFPCFVSNTRTSSIMNAHRIFVADHSNG